MLLLGLPSIVAAVATQSMTMQDPSGLPSSHTAMVALGESIAITPDVRLTVVAISEDSRCPIDVQCVQAGRLVIHVKLSDRTRRKERELELGAVTIVSGGVVQFAYATPRRVSIAKSSNADDLRFGFSFAPNTAF